MIPILEKYLNKRGINKIEEMSQEEKVVFDHWQKTLSEGEMSLENLVGFCRDQKIKVEDEWHNNPDLTDKHNSYLKALHKIYNSIISLIESPKAEKQALVKYLESLI